MKSNTVFTYVRACIHRYSLVVVVCLLRLLFLFLLLFLLHDSKNTFFFAYPLQDIAVNISIFQLIVDFLARLRSVVYLCFLSDSLTYPLSYRRIKNRYRFSRNVTLLHESIRDYGESRVTPRPEKFNQSCAMPESVGGHDSPIYSITSPGLAQCSCLVHAMWPSHPGIFLSVFLLVCSLRSCQLSSSSPIHLFS